MKALIKISAFVAATFFATSASAVPTVYDVSDAAGNCNGGPHGLWTNNALGSPSCDANYFSISGTLSVDLDTEMAVLSATALNPDNVLATINLTFSDFTDDHTSLPVKTGGGAANIADWIFFKEVVGTIDIAGLGSFDALDLTGGHGLQIGWGANDKTSDFGASVWLDMSGGHSGGNHWDINMDLAARVPAPAIAMLLGTGLIAVGLFGRRRA